MYSVDPLCLERTEIFEVCEPPIMTSLHPPSSAVGRPLPCLISGFSARFKQWREFSSAVREEVISFSVASEMGAMPARGGDPPGCQLES